MIGLFMLSSCISDLDFDTVKDSQRILTVQASLVKGNPHVFTARVQTLAGFATTSAGGIGNKVTLYNDLGQHIDIPRVGILEFTLEIPEDSPDFAIEDFMNFNIKVESNDGRAFESSMEQLLPVPKIEELNFNVVKRLEPGPLGDLVPMTRLEFTINTPTLIPNSQDIVNLRWTFEEVYRLTDDRGKVCYITQGLGAIVEKVFINPGFQPVTRLDDFELLIGVITTTQAEGNYFITLQQSLSPTASVYFEAVSELVDRDASIFTGPAGKIASNIVNVDDPNEDVFGYFYATTIDTVRVFISPESVGFPSTRCPAVSNRPVACPDIVCCDCLEANRSTTEQPIWWE